MTEDKDSAAAAAEPDLTPLGDDATSGDIAAAAERHNSAAAAARARAGHGRYEAEKILTAARNEAARIMAAAEAQAGPLTADATEAEEHAKVLEEQGRRLTRGASYMAKAEKQEALIRDLRAERQQLGGRAAAAAEQLKRLAARRRELESQLGAATGADDLAVDLADQVARVAEAERQVTAERTAALKRFNEIGAEDWPHFPKPPLAEAVSLAYGPRRTAAEILDEVWPDRPEAVHRRELAEERRQRNWSPPPVQPRSRATMMPGPRA